MTLSVQPQGGGDFDREEGKKDAGRRGAGGQEGCLEGTSSLQSQTQ